MDAASDNCPHAYNPDQIDAGGIGESSSPDGIGSACQCGDVDGTGSVTMDDGYAILTQGFSLSPLAMPDLCDVNGDGICDPNDFFVVISRLSGGTENLQVCPATLAGNAPSSAGLDLSVSFDGLGRLTSQTGALAGEPVSRSYSYDGLSRLKTAAGPWEKRRGTESAVTWTYSYDALGNLRTQVSSRPLVENGDHRRWYYHHASKPHFLTELEQVSADPEQMGATPGGEAAWVDPGVAYSSELLVWNALGKLHSYKDSAYSYDAFGQRTLVVTGPSGSTASIVSVGEDFEYDIGAARANKHFSLSGVRIASLATSYVAESASVPPSLRIALHFAQPLAAPAAASLLALGMFSLASLALRRRTPVWLAAPGVGVLSFALVALPYTAQAATLTVGAGRYGRHAEPILAYLVDHLGTVRAAVNRDGIVVETRDYAPFGESISHVGAFSVQHRFTGQPQDDQEGGLYDYGARFYNPKWGRFVSPDEVVQGFDSQGLNPFAYVLNRPTSATDPTGNLIWNGISYGARSTDIFGNVTGEGRGPTSGDKGQITVSGSSVHANSNGAPPGFFRFNFFDPGRDEVTIDPLTGAEPTGDPGALAGAAAAAVLGLLIEAYAGEGAEEPLCKDSARRDDIPIYHRKESPTQTPDDARRQEESGELWGRESRYGAWPQAKAFRGPLPPGQRGIEFTTSVKPDGSHPRIATWSGPRSGVRVEGGYAKVNIFVFRNTQR